jgi:hypothetical protein
MRKLLFTWLLSTAVVSFTIAQDGKVIAKNPEVITGQLIKITEPLSQIKPNPALKDIIVRDENGVVWSNVRPKPQPFIGENHAEQNAMAADPIMQKNYNSGNSQSPEMNAATIGANFNGMGFSNVNPPDPSLCVGPNHVIQMINGSSGAYFKVYNKTGGQVVAQTFLDAITGRGGLGDPVALYDQLADRYVLTEFANTSETGSEGLIFAVSQTNDPAGSWYVYFFSTGTIFPDYPKFSVWPDAYYGTTNDFTASYVGSTVYAFDRAKMIAGNTTATMQKFTLGSTSKFFSMCPVLWQGTTAPPSGTGGLIAYMADDAWTATTSDVDSIGLLEFKVNFTTPSSTTVTTKSSLAASTFKSDICTATRGRCISQPGSTVAVEALQQKLMNQPIYRNFGSYEGIVLTHIVDKGSNISGVRWYELTKTSGNWGINQQSTYTPDNTNRWMPGVCYDKFGNIGLAYNVSSSATGVFPGARFTGRKSCDPLNSMTYAEQTIVAGTAANASTRYGDYNHLVADPDGTTFWFTAEWNGASTWSTRVASFTLDQCTPSLCGDATGLSSSSLTNTSATISWTAVSGATSYDVDYKLSTSATWINAVTATTSTSVNLSALTQGSVYDWRVRANCASGSGNYVSAQFTTTSPAVCNAPGGLTSSSVTSGGATVAWTAVSGATSYTVEYKLSSATAYTTVAAAATGTSVSITGLTASSTYDWRVRANCASGSSTYTNAQFVTSAATSVCPGPLDVSTNGTRGGAATIPFNTDTKGLINPSGDNDYYKFVITNAGSITVTLGTLPGDYDLRLYRNNTQVAISELAGSSSETINYNATAGTYYARVYGYNGANSSTVCYTLKVALGTASVPETGNGSDITGKAKIQTFPNPVHQVLNVNIPGLSARADIRLFDINGRLLMRKQTTQANTELDIRKLANGVYFVKVDDVNGNAIYQSKIVKQ